MEATFTEPGLVAVGTDDGLTIKSLITSVSSLRSWIITKHCSMAIYPPFPCDVSLLLLTPLGWKKKLVALFHFTHKSPLQHTQPLMAHNVTHSQETDALPDRCVLVLLKLLMIRCGKIVVAILEPLMGFTGCAFDLLLFFCMEAYFLI